MRSYIFSRVLFVSPPYFPLHHPIHNYPYITQTYNKTNITDASSHTPPTAPSDNNDNNNDNINDERFLDAIRTGVVAGSNIFPSSAMSEKMTGSSSFSSSNNNPLSRNLTSSSTSFPNDTNSLSLGLDFSKMDFKVIASSTHRAINKELQASGLASASGDKNDDENIKYRGKLGGSVASVGSDDTINKSECINAGQQTNISDSNTDDDDLRKMGSDMMNRYVHQLQGQIGIRESHGGIIDTLRDYRLTNNWSGALSLFSNVVTAPKDYRHWYVQHVKIVLEMLLYCGKMEEAWKVWRLCVATDKLQNLKEAPANSILFRLGRLSLLREVVELQIESGHVSSENRSHFSNKEGIMDMTTSQHPRNRSVQQKIEWWGQVATELLQYMTVNNFLVQERNKEVQELIESKDHYRALTSFVMRLNSERDEFIAKRKAEHQNLWKKINHSSNSHISDDFKLTTADNDDDKPQAPDPTDVYELNNSINNANTIEEMNRLLTHANNNDIRLNPDTYALRIRKLALLRRGYVRDGPEPPEIARIWLDALALFNEGMTCSGTEGKPTILLCNAILWELRKARRFEELHKIEEIMRGESGMLGGDGDYWEIPPSSKTVDHIMSAYYREQQYDRCKSIFEEMKLNYAAKLSPLVYTIMIKIQSMETSPVKDSDDKFIFPAYVTDEQRAQGVTPRSAAIEAHQNLTNLVSEMVKDKADGGLEDNANIALINAWTHSRHRRKQFS